MIIALYIPEELADAMFMPFTLAASELQRQKYKRCIAMAKMCTELAERYQAEYDAEEGFGDCWLKWIRWARKWHSRWLNIADKFKEEQ